MKAILSIFCAFVSLASLGQQSPDNEIQQLSKTVFRWEVDGKMDSLENIISDKFMVVSSSGQTQNKKEYLARLMGGNFSHKKIDIEENVSAVDHNTATVIGKGIFVVVASGKEASLHLSYMQVFTKTESGQPWKLLAIYANRLQN